MNHEQVPAKQNQSDNVVNLLSSSNEDEYDDDSNKLILNIEKKAKYESLGLKIRKRKVVEIDLTGDADDEPTPPKCSYLGSQSQKSNERKSDNAENFQKPKNILPNTPSKNTDHRIMPSPDKPSHNMALNTRPATNIMRWDPQQLKTKLLPHQAHALAWMLWRETQIPCGGLLADDMGLGKSISMIALVLSTKCKKYNHFLVDSADRGKFNTCL